VPAVGARGSEALVLDLTRRGAPAEARIATYMEHKITNVRMHPMGPPGFEPGTDGL
jgi:hypothetical protein